MKCLSIFLVPSRNSSTPSTLEVLRAKERAPTPSPSIVFIFGFIIESIKELGGASSIIIVSSSKCVSMTMVMLSSDICLVVILGFFGLNFYHIYFLRSGVIFDN